MRLISTTPVLGFDERDYRVYGRCESGGQCQVDQAEEPNENDSGSGSGELESDSDDIEVDNITPFNNIRLLSMINDHVSENMATQNSEYYEGDADYPARLVQMGAFRIQDVHDYSLEKVTRAVVDASSPMLSDAPAGEVDFKSSGTYYDIIDGLAEYGDGEFVDRWISGLDELGINGDGGVSGIGNLSYTKVWSGDMGESSVTANLYALRYDDKDIVTVVVLYNAAG